VMIVVIVVRRDLTVVEMVMEERKVDTPRILTTMTTTTMLQDQHLFLHHLTTTTTMMVRDQNLFPHHLTTMTMTTIIPQATVVRRVVMLVIHLVTAERRVVTILVMEEIEERKVDTPCLLMLIQMMKIAFASATKKNANVVVEKELEVLTEERIDKESYLTMHTVIQLSEKRIDKESYLMKYLQVKEVVL